MKKTSALSLACVVLLGAILAGCSTHTITTADFVGTWTLTHADGAYEFVPGDSKSSRQNITAVRSRRRPARGTAWSL